MAILPTSDMAITWVLPTIVADVEVAAQSLKTPWVLGMYPLLEQHALPDEKPLLRSMSFPPYGDLTVAVTTSAPVTLQLAEDAPLNELVMEIVAIQKGSDVVVLIAYSATGAARQIVPIIDAFDDRWPAASDAIVRGEAGDIQGGITDAVPRLQDLPIGWTIEATGTLYVTTCAQS